MMTKILTYVILTLAFLVETMGQEITNSQSYTHEGISVLLSTPTGYSNDEDHPVILFLHGADRSNTKHHPSRYAHQAGIEFPFIVIAPSCTNSCSWSAVDLEGILKAAQEKVSIDPNRIYLTGYSMGGAGVWANMKKMPDVLAAAAPLAPAGGSPTDLCSVQKLPIRVYHGTSDGGYKRSQNMISTLKDCGSNSAELISLEGKGHGIWPGIFSDPSFYHWLLSNQK